MKTIDLFADLPEKNKRRAIRRAKLTIAIRRFLKRVKGIKK